jgi:hypothetical protein
VDRYCYILTPHPNLKKTPSGGRMMARMMSMQVAVLSDIFFFLLSLALSCEGVGEKNTTKDQGQAGRERASEVCAMSCCE